VIINTEVASPTSLTWFFEEIRRFPKKRSTDFNGKDIWKIPKSLCSLCIFTKVWQL